MLIRCMSDLHLEFGRFDLPVMEDEDKQVLVLAGDIGIANRPATFMPYLEEWSERFQDIIYIMGNHEHYGGSILRSIDKIKDEIQYTGGIHNVHVVNNEVVRIEEFSFICSTMWASYDKGNPNTLNEAGLWMNDHKKIRTGTKDAPYMKKFLSQDAYEEFLDAINFIFPAIAEERSNGQKTCVVTHHGPSWLSVPERYKTGQWAMLNGAYVSDLDEEIMDSKPDLWLHGHTHDSFDYGINETRVVVNPRGYYDFELNPNFNPELVIEIPDY